MNFTSIILSFIGVVTLGFAQQQNTAPKIYTTYHTTEAILIDGEESDASWSKVKWSEPFKDIIGVKTPKYKTQVKMLWDSTYFYVLAKLEEPHVWGDLIKRDTIIFNNNDFEVFIDPDGDTFNYYELEINALNTVWDLFINKPYRENNIVLNDWTLTGLQSAVKVNGTLNNASDVDQGWILEIAIPWKAFKKGYYHNNIPKDAFWRVNFSRVNWDHQIVDGDYERAKDKKGKLLHEYNWVWSPMGVVNMHEPEKWGYVFFSSKEAGNTIEVELPKDEKIKDKLFQIYRGQKTYYEKYNSWATTIKEIGLEEIKVENKVLNPVLENHSLGWNVTVTSPFSGKKLSIREDGKFSIN